MHALILFNAIHPLINQGFLHNFYTQEDLLMNLNTTNTKQNVSKIKNQVLA